MDLLRIHLCTSSHIQIQTMSFENNSCHMLSSAADWRRLSCFPKTYLLWRQILRCTWIQVFHPETTCHFNKLKDAKAGQASVKKFGPSKLAPTNNQIRKLLVIPFRKYVTLHCLRTLCNSLETQQSGSLKVLVTYLRNHRGRCKRCSPI